MLSVYWNYINIIARKKNQQSKIENNLGKIALGFLIINVLAALNESLNVAFLSTLILGLLITVFIPTTLYDWLPRLIGIIPITSLTLGICEAIRKFPNNFLWLWLGISLLATASMFILFIYRIRLFNRFSQTKALAAEERAKGLFGPRFENWFINIAYSIFCAFTLPLVVAATGSRVSAGVIAVFVLLVLLFSLLLFWHQEQDRLEEIDVDPQETRLKEIIYIFFMSLAAFLMSLFFIPATTFPNFFGSVSVVAISFSILVVVFSTIYNWGQQTKIPAITGLIIVVIVASFVNANDNHQIRQLSTARLDSLPTLETSFQEWLSNRPDREQYTGKPYPVYLAAAQGGGIYAAYHAATAFSKLSEYSPTFPQHVFAISGVSGGSLGSAAFASLVKANTPDNPPLSSQAKELFNHDLLSPLLALGLYPDLIQRFIPTAINDWDRALGLEVAFEQAWKNLPNQPNNNPFQKSFYQHWQPQGIAPALVLNTTIVETGERLVISPFKIPLPNQENIVLDERNLDLRLSTAAGLSARFPFVTPVGWFRRSDGSKIRLADGGYFDNSGVSTALDIGRTLQKLEGYGKSFEIIYLSLSDQPVRNSGNFIKSQGLNEIGPPLIALFNAREARSRSAVQLSTFTVNEGINDPFQYKFRTIFLAKSERGIKLPLGWLLSNTSQELIDGQNPSPQVCRLEEYRLSYRNGAIGRDVKNHNSCVARSIQSDLQA
jgi:hypothetical protein